LSIGRYIIKACYVLRILGSFPLRSVAFKVLKNSSEKYR